MSFDRVTIEDYGPVKKAELRLTKLHALIGPNDSGKSSILRAIRVALTWSSGSFWPDPKSADPFRPIILPFDPGTDERTAKIALARGNAGYGVRLTRHEASDAVELDGLQIGGGSRSAMEDDRSVVWHMSDFDLVEQSGSRPDIFPRGAPRLFERATAENLIRTGTARPVGRPWDAVRELASIARRPPLFARFQPSRLREASQVMPEAAGPGQLEPDGHGLAALLDALQDRGDGSFDRIRGEFLALFPTVKFLRFQATSPGSKRVAVELKDGRTVPSTFMSEGMLLFLAFAALRHVAPPSVILVEEPENGLHPARIRDVVSVLRKTSETTNVILATHSPLVLNELAPDEVSVVTRPDTETGTVITPIKETPDFDRRSSIYRLGELWLSYADGKQEAELLGRPDAAQ